MDLGNMNLMREGGREGGRKDGRRREGEREGERGWEGFCECSVIISSHLKHSIIHIINATHLAAMNNNKSALKQ